MSHSISISIVSHGQAQLVKRLLTDLDRLSDKNVIREIILTLNTPEEDTFALKNLPLQIIQNDTPKGFGENHNAAFEHSNGDYFCVLNPDIQIECDPFSSLSSVLRNLHAALVSPKIINSKRVREDSVRFFPTIRNTIGRMLGKDWATYPEPSGSSPYAADWVGGMFMLLDAEAYRSIDGFDERFFLYYEDADLCTRLWKEHLTVYVVPDVYVIHEAQRTSRRKLKYLVWHISSMLRYFAKHWMRLPRREILFYHKGK